MNEKIFKKMKWFLARVIFILIISAGFITGGIITIPLTPLLSYYFLNTLNPLRFVPFYYPLFISYLKYLIKVFLDKDYKKKNPIINFFSPPLLLPNTKNLRLTKAWELKNDNCDNCIKCCIKTECPLLDKKNRKCHSYGSFFYRYFKCGRYPLTQEQIDYYECPKWEFAKEEIFTK